MTLTEVVLGFVLIVATVFYASVSLFFSAVLRSTVTASIFSYLTVAMTLIGALFAGMAVSVLGVAMAPMLFTTANGEEVPRLWAIYGALFLTALSPLTAGGATAAGLIANEGAFLLRLGEGGELPGYPNGILLLSPWVIY
ncbi:MAG: hypothetical protein WKH64_14700, partial [Chloroflexia bacterium]